MPQPTLRTHRLHGVLGQVSCHLSLMTYVPKDVRRIIELVKEHLKIVMPRGKNYHHHQELNIRVEDQVYLQATPL